MHSHAFEQRQHSHNFISDSDQAEKSTSKVLFLTATMMVVEIVAGVLYGSMALLADGWHMATHVAAFTITLFAYRYARNHTDDPRFSFGTGKVSVLGGFASAVALAVVALVMALESVMRMFEPHAIHFNEAIGVAVAGLLVNLISGLMLHAHHEHDHDHDHDHEVHHHHHDHNLRAAYLHVLADALTSVFAIVALVAGKYFGWVWLDPVMGVVGAAVISKWSYNLVRDTSRILLDGTVDEHTLSVIKHTIEHDADNRITDLHVWQLGRHHYSASIAIVTHYPQEPDYYKNLLCNIPYLSHVSIEVNPCQGEPCSEKAGIDSGR
jgi:cation diffusion facilitator family transporter